MWLLHGIYKRRALAPCDFLELSKLNRISFYKLGEFWWNVWTIFRSSPLCPQWCSPWNFASSLVYSHYLIYLCMQCIVYYYSQNKASFFIEEQLLTATLGCAMWSKVLGPIFSKILTYNFHLNSHFLFCRSGNFFWRIALLKKFPLWLKVSFT